jgi:nitrate reductase gamma subunit
MNDTVIGVAYGWTAILAGTIWLLWRRVCDDRVV